MYPFLKNIIQLWRCDWMKQLENINESDVTNSRFTMDGGGKRLFCPFKRQEFWKCIGCVLWEVNYGKKGHTIWSKIPKYSCRVAPT